MLGVAFIKGALHVKPVHAVADPFGIARGDVDLSNKQFRFARSSGSRPFDVIGTEYPALRLLSHRAINVLASEAATGWKSCAVEITGKNGESIDGYELLVVTGRSGPIDNSRSTKVWKMPPPGGNPHEAWRGLYFAEDTWDGSDLFFPGDAAHMIVTDRIRVAFERAKITNASFVCLIDVERLKSELT